MQHPVHHPAITGQHPRGFQIRTPPEALPRLLLTHCSPHHHRQGLGACGCWRPGFPCASRSSSSRRCTACHHSFSHRDTGRGRVVCYAPAGGLFTGSCLAGSHTHGSVTGRAMRLPQAVHRVPLHLQALGHDCLGAETCPAHCSSRVSQQPVGFDVG